MAHYQEPFIVDTDQIFQDLEVKEQLREQAWSMALERSYKDAEAKFHTEALKSRMERAISIVDHELVSFDASGRLWVQSESRPDLQYLVRAKPCLCEDAANENAPNGFCKHRIASWIYAQASVYQEEIMASEEPVEYEGGNGTHADNDYSVNPVTGEEIRPTDTDSEPHKHYALTGAPARATIKWRDETGVEVWVNIEDFDDRTLLERTKKYQQYAQAQVARANQKGIQQFGTPNRGGGGRKPQGPKLHCEHHGADFFKVRDGNDYIHHFIDESGTKKWCKAHPNSVREFEEQHALRPKPNPNGNMPEPF